MDPRTPIEFTQPGRCKSFEEFSALLEGAVGDLGCDPVVEGRARAKQDRAGDRERRKIVPLLIHGDAAFVGQGVVAETLNLTALDGYSTGGTLHIIVNNQVGFTTDPKESRSTCYASSSPTTCVRCPA